MIALLLPVLLAAAAPPPPLTCDVLKPPALSALAGKDTKVSLQLERTSLDRVFKALGEQAGFKATFRGFTPVVSVAFQGTPLSEALAELASRYALRVESRGPDRLEVQAPVTIHVGGVTAPTIKERKSPDPVLGVSGKVVLQAVICEDGTVGAVAEAPGTDEPRLVQPAIDAVRGWTYAPAEKEGKPIAVAMTVIVQFH